ncbi:cytochrome d ubiquinol oxidase subunit II [Marinobacterium aestuariivivens]|uniref:Cytochrome d ubiquinol oxidase subunit II n=1 Tax=Marinobacterium aestuariivivens TaxID=1698799 RepID=A0ABW2A298_9GAMM
MELAFFYFLLLGFAILMYVVLDGFDLGLGILYPWFEQESQRDQMMRSISHVWDGNETWLVFGGVVLFAAFPAAYSAILSTLYVPIMIMLIALIFRGVAFEYRFKAHRSKHWWDRAFAIGSTVAAFCQGLMLGAVVQGSMQTPSRPRASTGCRPLPC